MSELAGTFQTGIRWIFKAPIYLYRYTLSALIGRHCRHEPSCSVYAIEAIDKNGIWRGMWLALARFCRCGPFGSSGYDPVPDLTATNYPFYKAWRYGVWRIK